MIVVQYKWIIRDGGNSKNKLAKIRNDNSTILNERNNKILRISNKMITATINGVSNKTNEKMPTAFYGWLRHENILIAVDLPIEMR